MALTSPTNAGGAGLVVTGTPTSGQAPLSDGAGGVAWGTVSATQWTTYAAYSTLPAAGTAGRRFICSDGPNAFLDSGSAWMPELGVGVYGTIPPAAANWTKIDAGNSTLTDSVGTLLAVTATADVSGGWYYSGALGSTFTVTVALDMAFNATLFNGFFGIGLRNAAAASLIARYGVYLDGSSPYPTNLQRQNFTNITTPSTVKVTIASSRLLNRRGVLWLRVQQDATNLIWTFSVDGYRFEPFWTESKTDLLNPANQLILFIDGAASGQGQMRVRSLVIV